jgi:UPF0755 protein
MIDDLNLDFEDHDRGRGRRRRTERRDSGADSRRQDPRLDPRQQGGWAGTAAQAPGGYDPRQQGYGNAQPYEMSGAHRSRGGHEQPPPDPRYGGGQWQGAPQEYDPRYDTGNQPRGYDPRYDTGGQPRGYDPRYDTGTGQEPRGYDPRYDTGSRAYQQLDDRYDTGSHRGGFIEDGYDDGGFLAGAGYSGDDDDGGRRRPRKVKKKKRRGRSFLALFLTLVLLGALGGGVYLAYDKVAGYFLTPDYDGDGTAEVVQIEVKQNQLLGDIANTLVAADVVKSYKAFVTAAEENPNAKNIQPGFYAMHKQMSGKAAVTAMLDPKNRNVKSVTIPEGMISVDIYAKLSKDLGIPVAEFQKVAANPKSLKIPDWWFVRKDGKKVATGAGAIEGFLFPDTYQFPPNATAQSALQLMVDHFLTVTGEMGFAENVQKNLNISPYEALVAASIGQKEVMFEKDLPKVSRVLYNRVYKGNWPCSCLQIDSAVNYWLRISGKSAKDSNDLTSKELLDTKNPYRTHVGPGTPPAAGLPIGPISNPGKLALQGAMAPAAGNWTYFMTIDKKGTMGYASSDAEFQALKHTACQNGVLYGDLC